MSAASGWPGSSPSGRLLTIIVTPWRCSSGIWSGTIWPLTSIWASSWRVMAGLLMRGDGRKHRVTIAQQLRLAHALDARQLGEAARPRRGDPAQRRIVEHDIRRDTGFLGDGPPDFTQRVEQRIGRALGTALALAPAARRRDGNLQLLVALEDRLCVGPERQPALGVGAQRIGGG